MSEIQFAEIVELIKNTQSNALRIVNTELINLYWKVGSYISRQLSNANWGEKKVDELADFIQKSHPGLRGFNRRGLYRMKLFYETYSNMNFVTSPMSQNKIADNQHSTIVSSPMSQLEAVDIRWSILVKVSWTHHLTLIARTKTDEEREFYLNAVIKENYSVKELERQINSGTFERTIITNVKLSPTLQNFLPNISNSFKDSYVFEFLNLPEPHNERELQKALISQMKAFVLELGRDFLFIGEEYKLQVGNSDFYIDLLFYHRGLQCLVAFELKADKFKPEQLGQLNFYLEALDRDVKNQNENPSIGILLCKDKDSEVVEYALSRSLSPAMVSDYKTKLPDKRILQKKLQELFENSSLPMNTADNE
jgi:predicted nuclease of restriction endonuclease-like (RecB) superfamily